MHAMSSDMYSGQLAEKFTNYYVVGSVSEYKRLMAEGKDGNYALFVLGMAMHALMDSTSPLHENYQKFSLRDIEGVLKGVQHLGQHFGGEGTIEFRSRTEHMGGVILIRRLFDEANQ